MHNIAVYIGYVIEATGRNWCKLAHERFYWGGGDFYKCRTCHRLHLIPFASQKARNLVAEHGYGSVTESAEGTVTTVKEAEASIKKPTPKPEITEVYEG